MYTSGNEKSYGSHPYYYHYCHYSSRKRRANWSSGIRNRSIMRDYRENSSSQSEKKVQMFKIFIFVHSHKFPKMPMFRRVLKLQDNVQGPCRTICGFISTRSKKKFGSRCFKTLSSMDSPSKSFYFLSRKHLNRSANYVYL